MNTDSDFTNIKTAMNVALEMLGRCEVWTAERVPALSPVKQTEVPWEILRPGTRIQNDWAQYIDKIIEHKPKGQQAIIRNRHEHLWHMAPDFCVLGSQNFWGYVVYGFTTLNLFVFECNEINNATYALEEIGKQPLSSRKPKCFPAISKKLGFITVINGTKTPEN